MTGSTPSTVADLAAELAREVAALVVEQAEIEMLTQQARSEATRHEQKRVQAADRIAAMSAGRQPDPADLAEANLQLVTLTRRTAVMESQVDVLEGKHKVLERYRESLTRVGTQLGVSGLATLALPGPSSAQVPQPSEPAADASDRPTTLSRVVLTAQEDLRRDIARAMHDGPAQSLTNIVLEAQIVERLLDRDPAQARAEVTALIAMVQRTLEATKTFIFDVRPMVLDDLGLVPTLRRVARDRSRRAQIPIEFESLGADRRLPMDVESGLFRIVDEALSGFIALHPPRVSISLDWAERLSARVAAEARAGVDVAPAAQAPRTAPAPAAPSADVPPALAAMIEEQREADRQATETAAATAAAPNASLPASTIRGLRERALTIGGTFLVADDSSSILVTVELSPA